MKTESQNALGVTQAGPAEGQSILMNEWIGSNQVPETSRPGMVRVAKSANAAMVVRPGAVISVA
jgi:hypothetical protein